MMRESTKQIAELIASYQEIAEKRVNDLNDKYIETSDIKEATDIDRNLQYWRGQNDAYKNILRKLQEEG